MRVLHVINTLGGSGGAENGLVREITRFGPDVEQIVIRLFARDDLEPTLTRHRIETWTLGLEGRADARNWPVAAVRIRSQILRYRPDVVHTSLFTANMAGQAAARLTRTPALSTFTQSGDVGLVRAYQPGAASRKASALRAVANRIARSELISFRALTTDAAVTNVGALRVPASRVRVIPRGVETALPPPDPEIRRRLGLPVQSRLVVNVGRQAAQKGQRFLLEAFELLAAHEPRAHLVVLGREGDASADLRSQLATNPARDRVHFLGFRSDARSILRAADVFLFSSLMEGLGTAVLEAMAASVPVVAFDIPPVREVTDSGRVAHLVPAGDAKALGTVALALLRAEEPDRARIAREWVVANYDIDHVAASLRSYLETVADAG